MDKFDCHGRGPGRGGRQQLFAPAALAKALQGTSLVALSLGVATAQELPSGGNVTAGAATITTTGSNLLVNQTTQNAILSWESFSVGANASAHFENGTGATLNRVTGNLPSSIDGALTATGSVYLINPAGVAVGSGGMVRTGGSFVASTHDMADSDFLAGGNFTLTGNSKAAAVNRGFITSLSGDVVLTARRVENSGTIHASQGSVGLLGGYEVELRDTALADGKFAVKIGGADTQVINTGTIRAAEIELRANGGSVQALAGNTSSIIRATGVEKDGGRIFLTAGDAITIGGDIDASGDGGNGGTIIAVAGDQLDLTATARLDASGANGGLILLGGDFQGGGDVATRYLAESIGTTAKTNIAKGATITADGTAASGGNIVVWGDKHTSFAGDISATGITSGGDAEVSGKATLAFTGTADLSASSGSFGTLLLDPYNVIISDGPDTGAGLSVVGSTETFTANANDSVINTTTLKNALNRAHVVVSTGGIGSRGTQAGNITVAAPLTWLQATTLTLNAYHSIFINAPIKVFTGSVALNTNRGGSGGDLSFGGGGSIDYLGFGALSINGEPYTLIYNLDQLDAIDGHNATIPWVPGLPDFLQPGRFLHVHGPGLGGRYALANHLDAAGRNYITSLIVHGDTPIPSPPFSGVLEGLGHTISNLNINAADNTGSVGLIGILTGSVRNIGLVGGSITGDSRVGGLAGNMWSGTIKSSYSSASINGRSVMGGLVGYLTRGSIENSYATGALSGDGVMGGLVGYFFGDGGSIKNSYATGTLSGNAGSTTMGGIAGFADYGAIIDNVYATGAVTVSSRGEDLGGLIGRVDRDVQINSSYATGAVNGGAGARDVGGLIGSTPFGVSVVTHSYWDSQTSGQSSSAGNPAPTAQTTAQFQSGTLPSGFDPNVWATGEGLYPYLRSHFRDGVQTVSGFVTRDDGSAMTSNAGGAVSVSIASGGTVARSATTGANGYYYAFAPAGTWTNNAGLAAFTQANVAAGGQEAVSYRSGTPDPMLNLNLDLIGNWHQSTTTVATMTGLNSDYATTIGATAPSVFAPINLAIDAASNFTIDDSLSVPGTLRVVTPGDLTIALGAQVSGENPELLAGGAFINRQGTDAVAATNGGRWLIYSANPTDNIFGDLNSDNIAIWNTAAGAAVSQAGNRYVFAYQPTLTLTPSNDLSKIYGEDGAAQVAALSFIVSSGDGGRAGAYRPDDLNDSLVTGAPVITSAGAATSASVGDYAITMGTGTLAATLGHRLAFATSNLAVTPRAITVTANNSGKVYGELDPVFDWTVGGLGLVNGDVLSGSLRRTAGENVGTYAIGQGTLSGSNYTITSYTSNDFTITPRAITVTADELMRIQGLADPALTFTISGSGLASFDTIGGVFAGTLTRAPGEEIGSYAISQGTLAANANYTMSFVPGSLMIVPPRYVVERQALDASRPLISDAGEKDATTLCGNGVLGPDCVAYVNPSNRQLGPFISVTE